MDDIIVTGNDPMEISQLKMWLTQEFEIKDLGHLQYFLGIKVARSKKGIFFSQRKHTLDLLTETGSLLTHQSIIIIVLPLMWVTN